MTDAGDAVELKGLIYGETDQFLAQLIGAAMIWTVIFGLAFAFFKIQDKLTKGGIRPTEEDELAGLDLPEMGVLAYPEFSMAGKDLYVSGTGTHDPVSTPSGPGIGGSPPPSGF